MTLKEWKARFQPGVKVEQIRNGQERKCSRILMVERVQSNTVRFLNEEQKPGFMDFPKVSEIIFTENGWQRLKEPGSSEVLSEYRWVTER